MSFDANNTALKETIKAAILEAEQEQRARDRRLLAWCAENPPTDIWWGPLVVLAALVGLGLLWGIL
jgi:hypothetical protein